jgi:two-component system KDP operon response regulator KdpE
MHDAEIRLLLVDDNLQLLDAISRSLTRSGYAVETAKSGEEGLDKVARFDPDLVVLDVMMPDMDGWEVCQRLRQSSDVPIIMLTARTNEADRVMGLKMGADDYVGKPFSLKELEARIEAVLRRSKLATSRSGKDIIFDDGVLRLDAASMQAILRDRPVNLTATERRILFTLAEKAGWVIAVDDILHKVWGEDYDGQSDYVKLYIWRLRQKIEPDPANPRYILTERGLGYRFAPPAHRPAGDGERE